jgi:hypothetical protein
MEFVNKSSTEQKIRYEIWPKTETKYDLVEVGSGDGGAHVTPYGTFHTLAQAQRMVDLMNGSVPPEKLMPERVIGEIIHE